jgi:hypothetical protein
MKLVPTVSVLYTIDYVAEIGVLYLIDITTTSLTRSGECHVYLSSQRRRTPAQQPSSCSVAGVLGFSALHLALIMGF